MPGAPDLSHRADFATGCVARRRAAAAASDAGSLRLTPTTAVRSSRIAANASTVPTPTPNRIGRAPWNDSSRSTSPGDAHCIFRIMMTRVWLLIVGACATSLLAAPVHAQGGTE